MFANRYGIFALALLMAGCQATVPQKQGAPRSAEVNRVVEGQQREQARLEMLEEQLTDLSGRLTLVQEQVLLMRQQSESLTLNAQGQVQALEQLQKQLAQLPEVQAGLLDQRLQELRSQLQTPPAAPVAEADAEPVATTRDDLYRLVTAYTTSGRWVLLRYRIDTGATWYIENGAWLAVEEWESPPESSYQLVIAPASADKKGYVAARIDQATGRSWWLKDNQWQPLEAQ